MGFLTHVGNEFQSFAAKNENDLWRHSRLKLGNVKSVPDPLKKVKIQNILSHQGEVPLFYFEILDLLRNFMFSLLENFRDALIRGWCGIIDMYCTGFKVHLHPNTISSKMQTWNCSKSDLTFFRNIWNFFELQYNLKFDTLCLMTELVKGLGLFWIWRHKLFCMHVHKKLMPCKWVCDVNSGIEPGPC